MSEKHTFNVFGEGWQRTEGMRPKIEPLPFDDIPQVKSFLERLEAFEPKTALMTYALLDNAGVSASGVRENIRFMQNGGWKVDWNMWKKAIVEVHNRSWEEIAPIIYKDML